MSSNVEDRRATGRVALGGGAAIVVAIIAALLGVDPSMILDGSSGDYTSSAPAPSTSTQVSPNDPGAVFVSKVLATTEDAWARELAAFGAEYAPPKLVLFRGVAHSACGSASSAVGPFYCPADQKAYLDLDFFDALAARLGAPGDFAQAYVIAHEIGHHVQNLTGASDSVSRGAGVAGGSVRMELQADCYAGVWGAYARDQKLLDVGDVDEALRAASAIGDDALQKQSRGVVVPESFTHGTAEQRARWFKRGMDTGDPRACDTSAVDASAL